MNTSSPTPQTPPLPPENTPPKLPPIPPASNLNFWSAEPPRPLLPLIKKQVEDPTWWRKGSIPYIVLILAAAAADLYRPGPGGPGLGAGIAGLLLTAGILMLRKDLSKGESLFLVVLSVINFVALTVSGNTLNYLAGLVIPFFLFAVPTEKAEPESAEIRYRNWWEYWVAHRPKITADNNKLRMRLLPTLISVSAAAILFIAFLTIFASGNPVVEQVWQWIITRWNELVSYLNISWDFLLHVLYWIIGIILFGLYTHHRIYAPAKLPTPVKASSGITLLPHLPLFSLIGINMAFLVATATDIAYLWFKQIPEGISQTQYLHDGADSIIWASILAALVLIFLFRRNGMARRSFAAKTAGYLLVAQTFLLAASVYMRLYYQICDYGFTYRRILAGELLVLGLVALMILICYMACDGNFRRFAKIGLGSLLLLVIAGGIITPTRLAATLNMCYLDSHPHWKFNNNDFRNGRFQAISNLAFAEIVYKQNPHPQMAFNLYHAAKKIIRENEISGWTAFTLNRHQDLPAAERIVKELAHIHNEK